MPALVRDASLPIPAAMNRRHSAAPAVQVAGSPPKEVRWPSDKSLHTASRERTEEEAWSFYWFETHAKDCRMCKDPYAVYKRGEHLCPKGEALARDVALRVHMRDGEVFECLERDSRYAPDRVEIPHSYHNLLGQLRAMERMAKHSRRRSHRPVVEYDQGPGQRVDDRRREDRYYGDRLREVRLGFDRKHEKPRHSERTEVVVEGTHSSPKNYNDKERSRRRRHSRSPEYRREQERERKGEKTYVGEERPVKEKDYRREEKHDMEYRYRKERDVEQVAPTPIDQEKKYRTEVRKPDKEYRKSGYYR